MAEDDVPLSSLARKPSTAKVDDNTPLSSLAAAGASRTPQKRVAVPKPGASPKPGAPLAAKPGGEPAAPGGAPAGKAKARPKQGARKGSSSSSYSYSYSSSSESEDGGAQKKPKRALSAGAKKKAGGVKKRKSQPEGLGESSELLGGAVKKKERTPKEEVVAQLLSRWWFADEYRKNDWPPQDDSFYQACLEKNKLRRVTIQEWEWLPEQDANGFHKVYELSQFKGVFRNSAGDLIDLRPMDRCPSLNNFMKKDMATLCTMLISAYENQLKELGNCRYKKVSSRCQEEIKVALTKIRSMSYQANAMK